MDLSGEKLNELFIKASQQVFVDMLAKEIDPKESLTIAADASQEQVLPSAYGIAHDDMCGIRIDFTGEFGGEVFLYFSRELGIRITKEFFLKNEVEMEDDEVAECIGDILTEFSNMLAGLFKGCLLRTNLKCLLGLPKMFYNEYVEVDNASTIARGICTFDVYGSTLLGDFVFYK